LGSQQGLTPNIIIGLTGRVVGDKAQRFNAHGILDLKIG
jgi:hypothetical protein